MACVQKDTKKFHECRKCPTKTWIVSQMLRVVTAMLIIIAVCAWTNKVKNENVGTISIADSFLSKVKIAIGFYQVTYGLLEAFSYIEWPESMRVISKYSETLQLNLLEIAPINCIFKEFHVDAFANLLSTIAINVVIIICAGLIYRLRKAIILRKGDLDDEGKSKQLSKAKETVYRNLVFFLYITNLSSILLLSFCYCASFCDIYRPLEKAENNT